MFIWRSVERLKMLLGYFAVSRVCLCEVCEGTLRRRGDDMKRFIALILIGMLMLTGCSSEVLATAGNGSSAESAQTGPVEADSAGKDLIDTEPAGKVVFTRLSAEDVLKFTGRELKPEPAFQGQVILMTFFDAVSR